MVTLPASSRPSAALRAAATAAVTAPSNPATTVSAIIATTKPAIALAAAADSDVVRIRPRPADRDNLFVDGSELSGEGSLRSGYNAAHEPQLRLYKLRLRCRFADSHRPAD